MEQNEPLVEPYENPFEALDDMDDEDEEILPKDQTTGTQVRCLPPQYNTFFGGQRYNDISE